MHRPWLVNDPFLRELRQEEIAEIRQRVAAWELEPRDFDSVLDSWFANFQLKDKPLAFKIFTNIDYYGPSRFLAVLRNLKGQVLRQISALGLDGCDLRIVTPEGGGDSAHRHAYDLIKTWGLPREAVCSLSEVADADLSRSVIVFFNDTHGSGKQFIEEVWPIFENLGSRPCALFITSVAQAAKARSLFEQSLGPNIYILPEKPTLSAGEILTSAEYERIHELGKRIFPSYPLGFGDTALLTAYYFQCPNNTLPLIWADGKNNATNEGPISPWSPLFPYRPKAKTLGAAKKNEATDLTRDAARIALDMPRYSWVEDLLELVRLGEWARVQVLPGNGAEDVEALLQQRFPDDRVVFLDLATLRDATALIKCIADMADTPKVAYRSLRHNPIARAVVGARSRLVMVVAGWGGHAQLYSRRSLRSLALALQGFRNVSRPNVVLVCLSPTSISHLLASPPKEGSILPLTPVLPSANDLGVLAEWARFRLSEWPQSEVEALILAASGQFGAIRSALRTAGRPHAERLLAIKLAHEKAGLEIAGSLGPCCAAVLRGAAATKSCLNSLNDAKIIQQCDGRIAARVGDWDFDRFREETP